MRIIAGDARGRKIEAPEGRDTRPTLDRVRENLFNMLQGEIAGSRVLDLFAGSGALSFEALSRGAERAYMVENSKAATEVIKRNAARFKCENDVSIFEGDVFIALKYLEGKRFDIIFMDPPYGKDFEKDVLNAIAQSGIISESGVVVIQYEAKKPLDGTVTDRFEVTDVRRYGRSAIMFLKLKK